MTAQIFTVLLSLFVASAAAFAQSSAIGDIGLDLMTDVLTEELRPWLATQSQSDSVISDIASPTAATSESWVSDTLFQKAKRAALSPSESLDNETNVRFEFWVLDSNANNQKVASFGPYTDSNSPEVATLLDLTQVVHSTKPPNGVTTPSEATHPKASNLLATTIRSRIDGKMIYCGDSSDFDLEILVKRGDSLIPVLPVLHKGLPLVVLQPSNICTARLSNNKPQPCSVDLAIDGFSFSRFQESNNHTHFILRPRTRSQINGCYMTISSASEFLVKSQGNVDHGRLMPGVAARFFQSKLSTITVLSHKATSANPDHGLFTNQGKEIAAKFGGVSAKREPNHVAEISIRYRR